MSFAAVYPLGLWLNYRQKIKNYYYRQLLISVLTGAGGNLLLWVLPVGFQLRLSGLVWLVAAIAVLLFYRRRDSINNLLVSIPALFGIIVASQAVLLLAGTTWNMVAPVFLGVALVGLYLSLAIYLLGKYDNNRYKMLKNSTKAISILLGLRLLFLVCNLYWGMAGLYGSPGLIDSLLFEMEGYYLFIGLFTGVLVPVLALWLINASIRRQAYDSAMKLIWPTLVFMILSELILRYYLLQYGLSV